MNHRLTALELDTVSCDTDTEFTFFHCGSDLLFPSAFPQNAGGRICLEFARLSRSAGDRASYWPIHMRDADDAAHDAVHAILT